MFTPTLALSVCDSIQPMEHQCWLLASTGVSTRACLSLNPKIWPARPLNAGLQVNISGPAGARVLKRGDGGHYSVDDRKPFLQSGRYHIDNASGGKDVGAFAADININTPT